MERNGHSFLKKRRRGWNDDVSRAKNNRLIKIVKDYKSNIKTHPDILQKR